MNKFIENLLAFEEGKSLKPYYCTEGYPTIYMGHRYGEKDAPLDVDCNFNFTDEECSIVFANDIQICISNLSRHDWFLKQDEDRQAILISMCFQLGYKGLLKFKNMIAALDRFDYIEARSQSTDSVWARQTPSRAQRHSIILLTGNMKSVSEYESF